MAEQRYLEVIMGLPKPAAVVYQLSSARTVQAVLAFMLAVVVVIQALRGQEVPSIVEFALTGIIGYHFGKDEDNGQHGQQAIAEETKD